MAEEKDGNASAVNHISVRLPEFAAEDAALWFILAENQFDLARVTSEKTKFGHVLSALPITVLRHISKAVLTSQAYGDLKKAVLDRLELSKPQIFEEMLRNEKIFASHSDRMRYLIEAAEKVGMSDEIIRNQFVKGLSEDTRFVVAAMTSAPLDEMATVADNLELARVGTVAAVEKN